MKKLLCLALVALLVGAPAFAANVPQLSGGLMDSAKAAAVCLTTGEYERLATLLPYDGDAPTAAGWEDFSRRFSTSGRAQTEYAVACWAGDSWHIAVPLRTPDSGGVEVLLLLSRNGSTVFDFRHATWAQVEAELHSSEHIAWDREYVGGAPQVFAD